MTSRALRTLFAAPLLALPLAAQLDLGAEPAARPRLYCATSDDTVTGAFVEVVDGRVPAFTALAPTDGTRTVRRFGQQLFGVNGSAGTVARAPLAGGATQLYAFEPGSMPMDVLVAGVPEQVGEAFVTFRDEPTLMRVDLATGALLGGLDLSPVGGGAGIRLGTMERVGSRLFVQVRVFADGDVPGNLDTGALAVVDLEAGALLDVDPVARGVQGVELQGAPPRFDMQVLDDVLYVSTTDSFNDVRGGIEIVDLETLQSVGFAITEAGGQSDMGGFAMVDATRGYYVFHTDLLASTHLVSFSVAGGPAPGPTMIDLLSDTVDELAIDPSRGRLYLPSGYADAVPGLYAFDIDTDALVPGAPVATGARPHDVLLVAPSDWATPGP